MPPPAEVFHALRATFNGVEATPTLSCPDTNSDSDEHLDVGTMNLNLRGSHGAGEEEA